MFCCVLQRVNGSCIKGLADFTYRSLKHTVPELLSLETTSALGKQLSKMHSTGRIVLVLCSLIVLSHVECRPQLRSSPDKQDRPIIGKSAFETRDMLFFA